MSPYPPRTDQPPDGPGAMRASAARDKPWKKADDDGRRLNDSSDYGIPMMPRVARRRAALAKEQGLCLA